MRFILSIAGFALLSTPSLWSSQQEWGGGFRTDLAIISAEAGDLQGESMSALGDLNGDGVGDIVFGASRRTNPSGDLRAGAVEVRSGADGTLLFIHYGNAASDLLGQAVSSAGDTNNDGFEDYAFVSNPDTVEVHSGADGSLLYLLTGLPGISFGSGLAKAGDLNGDSTVDLLVLGHLSSVGAIVLAISGTDGSEIWRNVDFFDDGREGTLTSISDVTGDGVPDCLYGGGNFSGGDWTYGAVLISGLDGSTEHAFSETSTGVDNGIFAWSVASVGDYNGDGVADIGIGDPFIELVPGRGKAGEIYIYSGADYSLIRNIPGNDLQYPGLGYSMANAGDVNGDGFDDLVASGDSFHGRLVVLSGQTGEKLYFINLGHETYNYAEKAYVQGLGDNNGDGELELLVGTPNQLISPSLGGVYILSFNDFLSSSASTISASLGGTVTLEIDFPFDNRINSGTMHYHTLFSGSGVSPTQIFGWNVPLAHDSLLDLSGSGNYPAMFSNPSGLLDPGGHATVGLTLAPGVANSLVGTTVHFAALQYEVSTWGQVIMHGPSRAVALEILP